VKRRLFNLAAAGSFIVCLGISFAWAASWRRSAHIGGETAIASDGSQRGGGLSSACGTVQVELWSRHYLQPPGGPYTGGVSHFSQEIENSQALRAARQSWIRGLGGWQWSDFALARQVMDLGFARSDGSSGPGTPTTVWTVALPYWSLAVLSGIVPVIWVERYRRDGVRRRRAAAGLCAYCGYDLRASGERCPECGGRRFAAATLRSGAV